VETAKSSQSLNPKIHFFPLEKKSKKKLRIVHPQTGAKMDDDDDEDEDG